MKLTEIIGDELELLQADKAWRAKGIVVTLKHNKFAHYRKEITIESQDKYPSFKDIVAIAGMVGGWEKFIILIDGDPLAATSHVPNTVKLIEASHAIDECPECGATLVIDHAR